MQPVLLVDVHAVVDVLQREDHTGLQPERRLRRHNRMHAVGQMLEVAVLVDVVQKVHAEIVEAEVRDGDPGPHVLQLDHLFLEPLKLLLPVGDVAALGRQHIVIAGRGDVGDDHAVFDAFL